MSISSALNAQATMLKIVSRCLPLPCCTTHHVLYGVRSPKRTSKFQIFPQFSNLNDSIVDRISERCVCLCCCVCVVSVSCSSTQRSVDDILISSSHLSSLVSSQLTYLTVEFIKSSARCRYYSTLSIL